MAHRKTDAVALIVNERIVRAGKLLMQGNVRLARYWMRLARMVAIAPRV